MRKIRIHPTRIGDKDRSTQRELFKAVANVLAWADFREISEVVFNSNDDEPFSFVEFDGSRSKTCDNVTQPPVNLKEQLQQSVLRAVAYNDPILFWVNLTLIRYFGCRRYALIEVIGDKESCFWDLTYCKQFMKFKTRTKLRGHEPIAPTE